MKCDTVKWVDPNWPETLQSVTAKLWKMYRDVKRSRVTETLKFMDKNFEFADEKEKLHMIIRQAQDELKIAVEEKQVTLALKAKAEQALLEARSELHQKKFTD